MALLDSILVWTWRCLDCGELRETRRNEPPVHCLWCAASNFKFQSLHSEAPKPEPRQPEDVVEFVEITTCRICQHEVSPDDAECEKCGISLGMPLAPN